MYFILKFSSGSPLDIWRIYPPYIYSARIGGKITIKECFMKSTIKVLGFIALVAIIAFSFTGCGDPEPEPDPVEKSAEVTEIDAQFNGKWGYFSITSGSTTVASSGTLRQISDGKFTAELEDPSGNPYKGEGTLNLSFVIYENEEMGSSHPVWAGTRLGSSVNKLAETVGIAFDRFYSEPFNSGSGVNLQFSGSRYVKPGATISGNFTVMAGYAEERLPAYQWRRADLGTNTYTAILGATASSYKTTEEGRYMLYAYRGENPDNTSSNDLVKYIGPFYVAEFADFLGTWEKKEIPITGGTFDDSITITDSSFTATDSDNAGYTFTITAWEKITELTVDSTTYTSGYKLTGTTVIRGSNFATMSNGCTTFSIYLDADGKLWKTGGDKAQNNTGEIIPGRDYTKK
jgi:hypothetical protein